jgi:SpoVK/Ycf46/Vps4 family AAA+-type ATPase
MGCKAQSNRNLANYSRKIEPRYTWDDIVLPHDIKKQLKEIAGYIKYRGIVYTDWGFDKKFSLGKGLNALFSGPSGTGKTMSVEIIAHDAGLDVYKIDLSNVVSKYIGETEKNLSKIFKEAETSNAILFFDEADALFGKRSEVKDAHDRYANIEIGYLLQKMEEYEGVVILATNLSKNIDDAFLRRMQFVIDFPFPDEEQRKLIWSGIFPKDAPRAGDIDYKFFAERLKLAGGNIKNIALSSAFYAAEESSAIGMHHIMRAAKKEYMKMGKPFLKEEFQPYYKMIEEEGK